MVRLNRRRSPLGKLLRGFADRDEPGGPKIRDVPVTVRHLRDDELNLYLEVIERSVRGLAASHYSQDDIEAWVVPPTDENLRHLALNADREIRLVGELDGEPVGIGALVLEGSELRAVYVCPEGTRRGCGSALLHEISGLPERTD